MSIYFYFSPIISPLGRAWPFIWINLNSLHQGIFCAKFGWNWPSGFGEEDENVKRLKTMGRCKDRQTDDGWQVIRKAHLSSHLRWVKISNLILIAYMFVSICKKKKREGELTTHPFQPSPVLKPMQSTMHLQLLKFFSRTLSQLDTDNNAWLTIFIKNRK